MLIISSFTIAYSDDEDQDEIKTVEELEILLEDAEAQDDGKLVRKINKHIQRLNWKASMESWKAEKQEIIELKDQIQQKIQEFKDIKNQAHKNGNGKRKLNPSVQNQIDNHQKKINRFETKFNEAEFNGDEKQAKRLEKQLKKFMEIEKKKAEKRKNHWKGGN